VSSVVILSVVTELEIVNSGSRSTIVPVSSVLPLGTVYVTST